MCSKIEKLSNRGLFRLQTFLSPTLISKTQHRTMPTLRASAAQRPTTKALSRRMRSCIHFLLLALLVLISSSPPSSQVLVIGATAPPRYSNGGGGSSSHRHHPNDGDSLESKAWQMCGSLKRMYDDIPKEGKFVTGAIIGFSASRMAIRSAVTIVKIIGATYVASEVLNAAGFLDDIPKMSTEQTQVVDNVKRRVLRTIDGVLVHMRKWISPGQIVHMTKQEPMVTLGAATGAFLGFLF